MHSNSASGLGFFPSEAIVECHLINFNGHGGSLVYLGQKNYSGFGSLLPKNQCLIVAETVLKLNVS